MTYHRHPLRKATAMSARELGLLREVAANDPEGWTAEQQAREAWVRAGSAKEIADAIRWQSEQALEMCRLCGVETP